MNWDGLIAGLISGGLILSIWAKISKQTIGELIGDISSRIRGTKEDTQEYVQDVMVYE